MLYGENGQIIDVNAIMMKQNIINGIIEIIVYIAIIGLITFGIISIIKYLIRYNAKCKSELNKKD